MNKRVYPLGMGKMTAGAIYAGAFKVYLKTFWQSCLANIVAAPIYLAALFVISLIKPQFFLQRAEEFVEAPGMILPFLRLCGTALVLCALLALIHSCVIARLQIECLFEGRVSFGKALIKTFAKILPIIWTFIVAGMLLALMWLLTVVAAIISAAALGVYMITLSDSSVSITDNMPIELLAAGLVVITIFLSVMVTQVFMLIPAIIANERKWGLGAVGRAFSLISGNFWRVFIMFFFWNLLWAAVAGMAIIYGGSLPDLASSTWNVEVLYALAPTGCIAWLWWYICSIFMKPLYNALVNVVYFDLVQSDKVTISTVKKRM